MCFYLLLSIISMIDFDRYFINIKLFFQINCLRIPDEIDLKISHKIKII